VERVASYQIEYGDLALSKKLKMKCFPISLTKSDFTWFSTLPLNSIHNWVDLAYQVAQLAYQVRRYEQIKYEKKILNI